MSVKIGILSDGSAIHFDHRNLFSNLASLNTAIRTTALTELELSALKAYTEIIHEGNRELVEIFCPWQNKSKRTKQGWSWTSCKGRKEAGRMPRGGKKN